MAFGKRARIFIGGVLIGTLLGGPPRLVFGGDSSKGSNDSSGTSTDSSKNSTDSSNRSENSTENSPKDSTEESSDGTSDSSDKRKGAVIISVALLLVALGATTIGLLRASGALAQADEQQKMRQLARFLQRHHPLVARDVVMGEGPLLSAWGRALGLGAGERDRLSRLLDGSAEQAELLAALDGRIDEGRARRFAVGFTRLGQRALGDQRMRAIAIAALR
jgi:hypothetical protein